MNLWLKAFSSIFTPFYLQLYSFMRSWSAMSAIRKTTVKWLTPASGSCVSVTSFTLGYFNHLFKHLQAFRNLLIDSQIVLRLQVQLAHHRASVRKILTQVASFLSKPCNIEAGSRMWFINLQVCVCQSLFFKRILVQLRQPTVHKSCFIGRYPPPPTQWVTHTTS